MRREEWICVAAAGALLLAVFAWATTVLGQGLDLPVERPAKGQPAPPKAPDPPTASQGEAPRPATIYGRELSSGSSSVVYVLDVSGSMGLDVGQFTDAAGKVTAGDRLDRAKAELEKSLNSLPPSWRFGLVAYDCTVLTWATTLREATAPNKAEAAGWVRALKPGGATATGLATAAGLALDRANLALVLLTDGAPNCDSVTMNGNVPPEVHRRDIRAANVQGARIDVYGIACPSGSTFEQFCRDVASDNNGTYTGVR